MRPAEKKGDADGIRDYHSNGPACWFSHPTCLLSSQALLQLNLNHASVAEAAKFKVLVYLVLIPSLTEVGLRQYHDFRYSADIPYFALVFIVKKAL